MSYYIQNVLIGLYTFLLTRLVETVVFSSSDGYTDRAALEAQTKPAPVSWQVRARGTLSQ